MILEGHEFTQGRIGSSTRSRMRRVSRKTGRELAGGGFSAELNAQPWAVDVDARDLARYTGNSLLRHFKEAYKENVHPSSGASHGEPKRNRILMGRRGLIATGEPDERWPAADRYLYDGLRRTLQRGRSGRWVGIEKTHLKIYFSPNGRVGRGGYGNPAASWNKFMDMQGMPNLDLDGVPDGLIESALDRWLADVLAGGDLGADTNDEAFGRVFY